MEDIYDSINYKISQLTSESSKTTEKKKLDSAKSSLKMGALLPDPTIQAKISLLYQTLLQLRMFINKWCGTIAKVNDAREKCVGEMETSQKKNQSKIDTIHTKSTNGKVQDQVRKKITDTEFDDVYDIIYKVRKTMDTDYNTLET